MATTELERHPTTHVPEHDDAEPQAELAGPTPEPAVAQRRYTVSSDFDGVIHSYTSGWQGADVIPDPPIEGAIDWLNEVIVADYDVMILTTRARHEGGPEAVMAYLREHGFTGECLVTSEKHPALIYVDDRGWRFNGRFPSLRQIRHMKPWRVGDHEIVTAAQRLRERGKHMHLLQERHRSVKADLSEHESRLASLREKVARLRESVEFREATEPLYPDLTEIIEAILA